MFGYSKIFRSRWWALLWAAGICWMAYDVAGGAQAGGGNDADADTAALQNVVDGL